MSKSYVPIVMFPRSPTRAPRTDTTLSLPRLPWPEYRTKTTCHYAIAVTTTTTTTTNFGSCVHIQMNFIIMVCVCVLQSRKRAVPPCPWTAFRSHRRLVVRTGGGIAKISLPTKSPINLSFLFTSHPFPSRPPHTDAAAPFPLACRHFPSFGERPTAQKRNDNSKTQFYSVLYGSQDVLIVSRRDTITPCNYVPKVFVFFKLF